MYMIYDVSESNYRHWKKQIASGKIIGSNDKELLYEHMRLTLKISALERPLKELHQQLDVENQKHLQTAFESLPWWRKKIFKPKNDFQLLECAKIPEPCKLTEINNEILQINVQTYPYRMRLGEIKIERGYLARLKREIAEDNARLEKLQKIQLAKAERINREKIAQEKARFENDGLLSLSLLYGREIFSIRNKDYKRGNRLENYIRDFSRPTIVEAFDSSCVLCGQKENLVLDHFAIPKNEGGNFILYDVATTNYVLNVAVLCNSCNSSKGECCPFKKMSFEKNNRVIQIHQKLLVKLCEDVKLRKTLLKWYEIDGMLSLKANLFADEKPK
jgi:hypothetical protein